MNPFVADPEWGWWITLYFYLGGIAAGAYFLATLIDLWGQESDRHLAHIGFRLAFPLICVCGLFLTVDLERPERFWHMLLQSEVVDQALEEGWPLGGWGTMLSAPILKWWSPMSIGAWSISLFGLCSFLSFMATLWPGGRLARLLRKTLFGRLFHLLGSAIGFFVASYTGVLLTATNQPLWSTSDWIGPLFLASAASTGAACILLLATGRPDITHESRRRLEHADLWALGLELFIFLIFLASLGGLLPLALRTWPGQLLVGGTLILGLLVPLSLHVGVGKDSGRMLAASLFALAGGFLLRFGIVRTAPELLAHAANVAPDSLDVPLLETWEGKGLVALTLVLAIVIPLILKRSWQLSFRQTALAGMASLLVTAAVVYLSLTPSPASAFDPLSQLRISPEDQRPVGGGPGASSSNRPEVVKVRSKITGTITP